jgi:sugar/nucleoside kinase (ribokinase family)
VSPEASPPPPRSLLCLGEARVDMICQQHVPGPASAASFAPHFGGTPAVVALRSARAGVATALAGGAGADDWGRWLAETLLGAGVDTFHFRLIHGTQTPLALSTVDDSGETLSTFYADAGQVVVEALGAQVEPTVAAHGALFITSSTLIAPLEREATMRARAAALKLARPVIFDPSFRLERWSTRADAAASANACVPGAVLVRVDAAEARLMTGEEDLERAAMALRKTGAANVVICLEDGAAMLRGRIRADARARPVDMRSTLGRGAAVTATLIARLATSGFYEPAIAAGLSDAVAAGAEAAEHWGAVD